MKQWRDELLRHILGVDGAAALDKAMSVHSQLSPILLPRALIAWIEALPGSRTEALMGGRVLVDFQKGETGYYTGQITAGDAICDFDEVSVYHLAAVLCSLVGETRLPEVGVHGRHLASLGKSIDLLVKSRTARAEAFRRLTRDEFSPGGQEGPGPPAKPQEQVGPQVALGPEKARPKPRPKLPRALGVAAPKPPPSTTLNLSEKSYSVSCDACGRAVFHRRHFRGCLCFADLVRFAKTESNRLILDRRHWDEDSVILLMDMLEDTDG